MRFSLSSISTLKKTSKIDTFFKSLSHRFKTKDEKVSILDQIGIFEHGFIERSSGNIKVITES